MLNWYTKTRLARHGLVAALLMHGLGGCKPHSTDADVAMDDSGKLAITFNGHPANQPLPLRLTASQDQESELFWEVLASYHTAKSYSDRGEAVLKYRVGGEMMEDRAPLSVRWQSPDRLQVKAYDARLLIENNKIFQWILNAATDDFDRQLAVRDLSGPMNLEAILQDEAWSASAAAGLAGPPPQLTWLFLPPPKENRPEVKKLADVSEGGKVYWRYSIGTSPDHRIFWIDKSEKVIQRVELPPPPTPDATEVVLTVELQEATFAPSPSALIDQVLPNARKVKSIVPPPPLLPSPLLGRVLEPFRLSSHDARVVITEKGTGRITLLVWVADHPASQAVLRDLQRFADTRTQKIDLLIVMSEPNPNRTTGDLLRSWHVGLPWSNDETAVGRDVFKIREAPTFVILDPTGKVQFVVSRWSEQLVAMVAEVVDQLGAGRNPGEEMRKSYEIATDQYRKQLQAMTLSP